MSFKSKTIFSQSKILVLKSFYFKSNGCENKETDKEFYEQCMFNRVLIWLSTQEKFVIKSNLIQEFNLKESTYTKIYNTLEGESVLKVINKNKK